MQGWWWGWESGQASPDRFSGNLLWLRLPSVGLPQAEPRASLLSVYFLPGFCTHCGFLLEELQWELWGLLWGAGLHLWESLGSADGLQPAARTLVPEFPPPALMLNSYAVGSGLSSST